MRQAGVVSLPPTIRRKESFDAAASDYARYRTGYPDEVVDDVVNVARLQAGSRVLEIGCGTGQLSVPLARRGVQLVAVELGSNLASIARRHLSGYPGAQVEVAAFEQWQPPASPFDAVVAASAFHWIDPQIRFRKSARALRPGGVLAIVQAHQVKGGTPGFVADTQPYYLRWGLSDDPSFEPAAARDAPVMYPELEQVSEFEKVRRHRFEIPRHHTTDSYIGWLKTDSLILGLEPVSRQRFLDDLQNLIDNKYDGAVSQNFVYDVIAATRA
jgi:protein-L-isoaspartate O-methyltransferase